MGEVKNCAEAHHDKQNKKSRNNNQRYVDLRRKQIWSDCKSGVIEDSPNINCCLRSHATIDNYYMSVMALARPMPSIFQTF